MKSGQGKAVSCGLQNLPQKRVTVDFFQQSRRGNSAEFSGSPVVEVVGMEYIQQPGGEKRIVGGRCGTLHIFRSLRLLTAVDGDLHTQFFQGIGPVAELTAFSAVGGKEAKVRQFDFHCGRGFVAFLTARSGTFGKSYPADGGEFFIA